MSFNMYVAMLILASMIGGSMQASHICKEGKNWWYDIQAAKCRPCKECSSKAFMMEPCSNFMDAMCIDISELEKSIKESRDSGQEIMLHAPFKWHEMEGRDSRTSDVTTDQPFSSVTSGEGKEGMTIIFFGFFFIMMTAGMTIMIAKLMGKCPRRPVDPDLHNRFLSPRNKHFSRDHQFNTTEFMNNLATLDRLAMEEILEKRKAIFEPPLLVENVYVDVDGFIDLSSVIPKSQEGKVSNEKAENRICLLKMQEDK